MDIEQHIISTRDFMRHFSTIAEAKEEYLIVRHGKPIGVYTPITSSAKKNTREQSVESQKRLTFEDLKKYRFHSGEKSLSERIDEIVYGVGRNTLSD